MYFCGRFQLLGASRQSSGHVETIKNLVIAVADDMLELIDGRMAQYGNRILQSEAGYGQRLVNAIDAEPVHMSCQNRRHCLQTMAIRIRLDDGHDRRSRCDESFKSFDVGA